VTAGPTKEMIDPVRFISNESSGKQGYAIAETLQSLGAKTTLVSGPTSLTEPNVEQVIKVDSADQMLEACESSLPADIAVCAAAVAAYKIANKEIAKIKKDGSRQNMILEENPDILERLSKRNHLRPKLVVGFAAETSNLERNSKVLLTTSSAQKVYGSVGRSKINPKGSFSKQKNLINILDNSHLEYLPQETIIFANGLYEQIFKISISETSSFLFTDLIRLGRSSSGESIESGVYRSKLEIMRKNDLIDEWEYVDQIELSKARFVAKSGMDYKPVFGSINRICEKEFSKSKI